MKKRRTKDRRSDNWEWRAIKGVEVVNVKWRRQEEDRDGPRNYGAAPPGTFPYEAADQKENRPLWNTQLHPISTGSAKGPTLTGLGSLIKGQPIVSPPLFSIPCMKHNGLDPSDPSPAHCCLPEHTSPYALHYSIDDLLTVNQSLHRSPFSALPRPQIAIRSGAKTSRPRPTES